MKRRDVLRIATGVALVAAAPVAKLLLAPAAPALRGYNFHGAIMDEAAFPGMTMVVVNKPVVARARKIKANWTLEDGFSLRPLHGEEIEIDVYQA